MTWHMPDTCAKHSEFRGSQLLTSNIGVSEIRAADGLEPSTISARRIALSSNAPDSTWMSIAWSSWGTRRAGDFALCLAAHESSLRRVISLAGVVDLKKAFGLHLSHDAVAEFLGGTPDAVAEHYREADPLELAIPNARQWLIHGKADDTVPPDFSRDYVSLKKKAGESAELLAIPHADTLT